MRKNSYSYEHLKPETWQWNDFRLKNMPYIPQVNLGQRLSHLWRIPERDLLKEKKPLIGFKLELNTK